MKVFRKTIIITLTFLLTFIISQVTTKADDLGYSYYETLEFEETIGFWPFKETYVWVIFVNKENNRQPRKIHLKKLTSTFFWEHDKAESATISIAQTITVSETTAKETSIKLGLKVPLKVAEVYFEIGGSRTKSTTYTIENSVSHTYKLTQNSPVGYYSLQATVDADKFQTESYSRKKKSTDFTSKGIDYLLRYRSEEPYIMLKYTTDQH